MKTCLKETRKPIQKRSIDKKNALLKAGLKLISLHGLQHINSKDIAKEAGVSIGSFYAYFKDKNALFYDLVQTYKNETTYKNDTDECYNHSSNVNYIEIFLMSKIDLAKSYPASFHSEIHYQRTRDQSINQLYEEYKTLELQSFKDLLNSISDELALKDTEMASTIAFNVYQEMITSVLAEEDESKQYQLLDGYIELLSKYLFNN